MTDSTDLFHQTLKVFGERDGDARRSAIEQTYAEDVSFTDPDETVVGRAAVDAKVQALLDGAPADFVFVEDGPLYVAGDTGALAWAFGPAGAPVVRGIDVMTVRDGRVATLLTLLSA